MPQKNISFTKLGLVSATAVAMLVSAGCQSGQIRNDMMDSAQESAMGKEASVEIDSSEKLDMDGKLNRRVLDIATPIFLQAQKDRPDVSFRIRVIDSPEINAFSIPGGYVYVYKGLIDKIGNDDDALACVIGHESAHVVRRHIVKEISDSENKGVLVDLASVLTRSGAVDEVGSTLFQLDQLHYSREAEYEADRWGEKFAYNAGFDPSGMVRTFRIFETMEQKSGDDTPAYAMDHPINQNRILRVEEQLRELRANHGHYVTEAYDPNADKIAAQKNGIDYQTLVLATNVPTVAPAAPATTRPAVLVKPSSPGQSNPYPDQPSQPNQMPPSAPGSQK